MHEGMFGVIDLNEHWLTKEELMLHGIDADG